MSKTCPKCGAAMHLKIRVCRGCGHEFYAKRSYVVLQKSPSEDSGASDSRAQTLRELLNEIGRLRDTIVYCEVRILRKELAFEELQLSGGEEEKPTL